MATALSCILGSIIGLVVAWLLIQLGLWARANGKGAIWTRLGQIARDAVLFAQQYLADKPGEERYTAAAKWFADTVALLGLRLNPALVRGFIESALAAAKLVYPNLWPKAPPAADGTATASP